MSSLSSQPGTEGTSRPENGDFPIPSAFSLQLQAQGSGMQGKGAGSSTATSLPDPGTPPSGLLDFLGKPARAYSRSKVPSILWSPGMSSHSWIGQLPRQGLWLLCPCPWPLGALPRHPADGPPAGIGSSLAGEPCCLLGEDRGKKCVCLGLGSKHGAPPPCWRRASLGELSSTGKHRLGLPAPFCYLDPCYVTQVCHSLSRGLDFSTCSVSPEPKVPLSNDSA